jgi:hypothetical protein
VLSSSSLPSAGRPHDGSESLVWSSSRQPHLADGSLGCGCHDDGQPVGVVWHGWRWSFPGRLLAGCGHRCCCLGVYLIRRRRTTDTERALVVPDASERLVERPAAYGMGAAPDPAAEAVAARGRAAEARDSAALVTAQAQQRAAELIAEAQRQATELEFAARAADDEAERHQAAADRAARITRLEADLTRASAWRDSLAAETAELDAIAAEATARLAVLTVRRAEADQRRAGARQAADVDGVRDAVAVLDAIGEVAASEAARLDRAQVRLAEVRAAGGELEQACADLASATVELAELHRERCGQPRRAELVAVAQQLVPLRVASMLHSDPSALLDVLLEAAAAGKSGDEAAAAREQMAEAVAAVGNVVALNPAAAASHMPFLVAAAGRVLAPQIAAWLERLAAEDPDGYQHVVRSAFRQAPVEPDIVPDLAPGFAFGPDGTMTYLGRVSAGITQASG